MDISISSPVLSPRCAFRSPSSDGQGIATWIDDNDARNISEYLWDSESKLG